jgi:hypothetical protein
MTTIHPDSKLGQLQAAVEAARAAHQATMDHLGTLATEAGDLDRWIERAGLDTAPLDFAKKHARRMIVANVMARARIDLTTQQQTLAELKEALSPLMDTYHWNSGRLPVLLDHTSNLARQMTLRDLEEATQSMKAWLQAWTEPEAATVDALALVEA